MVRGWARIAAIGLVMTPAAAMAGEAARAPFGTLPDGRQVEAVTLTNGAGVSATVISWGALLQSVIMPDRDGNRADVALGHATLERYLEAPEYFGATIGRYANRIAAGRYTLDGRAYQAPVNDGEQSLHGGTTGFDKVLWQITDVQSGPTASVTLRHVSPDGDMGYPGALTVNAKYSLDEAGELRIEYSATTDRPTIVNLTNHAFWNLAGEGSSSGALGHVLTIPAERFTPVDAGLIPTGELKPVEGTVFDFRQPHVIGERVREATDEQILLALGYDHNWVVSGNAPTADVHTMATLSDPVSGRSLELLSNQPGLQFYSGNFFDGSVVGRSGKAYRQGDGIALEPQIFPDTPNQDPAVFGSARLDPGRTYRNIIVYRLKTEAVAR